MTDRTALTVGPLRVIVAADEPAVHQALRAAYRSFTVGSEPVPHTLTVRVTYLPGPAPAAWPFTFDDGVLHFTAAHGLGQIDVRRSAAQVSLTAPHPFEPVDYVVRAALALLAFEADGLLFHAAGLARRGVGYGFFGYSGSGKTTVARVSTDAVALNDDLVVLLPHVDRWEMAATPFSNPTQVSPGGPQIVPLAALYRLVQNRSVFVEPLESAAAVAEVIASSPVVCADPDRTFDLLARAERLVTAVPVQRLHFLPDASFWQVIAPAGRAPADPAP
jgi:hypothetical protein